LRFGLLIMNVPLPTYSAENSLFAFSSAKTFLLVFAAWIDLPL
jgi:hypothetical protein